MKIKMKQFMFECCASWQHMAEPHQQDINKLLTCCPSKTCSHTPCTVHFLNEPHHLLSFGRAKFIDVICEECRWRFRCPISNNTHPNSWKEEQNAFSGTQQTMTKSMHALWHTSADGSLCNITVACTKRRKVWVEGMAVLNSICVTAPPGQMDDDEEVRVYLLRPVGGEKHHSWHNVVTTATITCMQQKEKRRRER